MKAIDIILQALIGKKIKPYDSLEPVEILLVFCGGNAVIVSCSNDKSYFIDNTMIIVE